MMKIGEGRPGKLLLAITSTETYVAAKKGMAANVEIAGRRRRANKQGALGDMDGCQ